MFFFPDMKYFSPLECLQIANCVTVFCHKYFWAMSEWEGTVVKTNSPFSPKNQDPSYKVNWATVHSEKVRCEQHGVPKKFFLQVFNGCLVVLNQIVQSVWKDCSEAVERVVQHVWERLSTRYGRDCPDGMESTVLSMRSARRSEKYSRRYPRVCMLEVL